MTADEAPGIGILDVPGVAGEVDLGIEGHHVAGGVWNRRHARHGALLILFCQNKLNCRKLF
jgi:hypothetical protein